MRVAAGIDKDAEKLEGRMDRFEIDGDFAGSPVDLCGFVLSEAPVEGERSGTAAKLGVEGAGVGKFRMQFREQSGGSVVLFIPEKEIAKFQTVAIKGSGRAETCLEALGVCEPMLAEEKAQEIDLVRFS